MTERLIHVHAHKVCAYVRCWGWCVKSDALTFFPRNVVSTVGNCVGVRVLMYSLELLSQFFVTSYFHLDFFSSISTAFTL